LGKSAAGGNGFWLSGVARMGWKVRGSAVASSADGPLTIKRF